MNEFVAKKLGEVLAFAEVGNETLEKGRMALESVLGEEKVNEMIERNKKHAEKVREIAEENNVTEIVMTKLDSTGKKLRAMRDLYVGVEWDNPTELLEWSGFFEGAAVVHWALVSGAGEKLNHEHISPLADEAKEFHRGLLHTGMDLLHEVGATRAEKA